MTHQCNVWQPPGMAKEANLNVRISADLKAKLQASAKEQERSVAWVVERIIRAHYEREALGAEMKGKKS